MSHAARVCPCPLPASAGTRCEGMALPSLSFGACKEWLTCGKRPADEGWAYMSETCELVVWNCTRAADRLSPSSAFRPPNVAMPLHGASELAGQLGLPTQPPLARPVAPVPDNTGCRSKKWMLSALSPVHNVVPRNRSIEWCHPFVQVAKLRWSRTPDQVPASAPCPGFRP